MLALVLGAAAIAVDRVRSPRDQPIDPLTDERATTQVVDAAAEVVSAAGLVDVAGAAALLSCTNADEPPYQAVVDMTFELPQVNSVKFLRELAAVMVTLGWSESPVTGQYFGHVLTRAGATASFHRNLERADVATMRIGGECRIVTDHRDEASVWTDVIDRLRSTG